MPIVQLLFFSCDQLTVVWLSSILLLSFAFIIFVTNIMYMWQEFLKKEQERKEAELLAEKQDVLRKRKEEKRVAREV